MENIKLTEELNLLKESQRLSADSGHDGNDDRSSKPVETFKRNFSSRGVLVVKTADDGGEDDFCEMTDALKVLPPRVSFFV